MKIIIFLIVIISIQIIPQETPLEKNNYQKLTSYDELSEFVYELESLSDFLKVEIIGKSVEGRNLYALKFSNSEFGKDTSKIKVLIFTQQHGDEQSGKEGALLLACELLKQENKYLFEKIDLALVPQMNPDGSEKNQRRNGNYMDLNRNHLILTEPETIGLHKLFNKYLFEVAMDVHEYYPYGETWKKYGYRENNDEEVGSLTNINVSKKILDLSREYLVFINQYLINKSFTFFEYCPGGPPEINYVRRSTFDINDGRQSLGIQNTFSFIQEGLNGKDSLANIEKRTEGQMLGMMGLIVFSFKHKDEVKNLVASEREKLVKNEVSNKVAIQLDHFSDGSKLEFPLLSYYSNKDTVITVNDYRPVVKSLCDVERPEGYLIPKDLPELYDWTSRQNLTLTPFKNSSNQKIIEYFISTIDSIDFEGDTVVNPIVESREFRNQINPDDYYFIPTNQLKNNLIVIALEPKSELGLVTYKNFEHLLKKGEYFPILRVVNQTN
jgi:Zinc carboxypeptidase